jgi:hypothetical protein
LHLTTNTRPDIIQAVEYLTQFNSNPDRACWAALKYLLRYFKGTRTKNIIYKFNSNPTTTISEDITDIIGYSDSDWASDSFTNHSITKYIFMSVRNPIIWGSKKQSVVILSSCEAEYIAALYTARVAIWLRNLMNEIGFIISTIPPPIPMAVDNQGTIAIIKMDVSNRRTRYINIRYYHFREYIKQDIINPYYISTSEMLTDNFTKALDRLKFIIFTTFIGMQD